uniref:Uncharacterized protein n=1 Tax=Anopheles stephensi TaxID=30069 RepID=A0A182XYE6_ANOST
MDYSKLFPLAVLLLLIGLTGECEFRARVLRVLEPNWQHGKCLNTVKICQQGEDACLTEIRWGSTPYFSLGAQKQFYVSKRCAKKEICQRIRTKHMPYCTHIWYEDWTCSACCLGDRCNYYVISAAPTVTLSALLGTVVALGVLLRSIIIS